MTFNLLAPVWASPKLYPSVEQRYLDPAARRRAQHAYIRRADADIIFLQECQETELELPQMFI